MVYSYSRNYRGRFPSIEGNIGDLVDGVARANKVGGGLDIGKFVNEFDWDNLQLGDASQINFTVTKEGGEFVLSRDGQRVNGEKVQRAMREGDLLTSLREMKFDDLDASVVEYANSYETRFKSGPAFKAGKEMDGMNHSTRPDPSSGEAFEAQVRADPKLEARMDQMLKDLKAKMGADGKLNVGKWVKRGIIGAGIGLGLAWLYQEVVKHQQVMNGCWLLDLKAATEATSKCKIATLCCSDADTTSTDVQPFMCLANDMQPCGDAEGQCFLNEVCVAYDASGEQCTQKVGDTSSCGIDGICKSACADDMIDVPVDTRLVCVRLNFWDATEDFFNDIIDTGLSTLTTLFKIALALVALYFVYQMATQQSQSASR